MTHNLGHPAEEPAGALDGPTDLFKAMFDTSRVASFVFDEATFSILIANDAALQFYGYTHEQFTALTVPDLVDPDHWDLVGESLRSGHPRDVDNVHRHADGRELPVTVSAYRLVFPTRVIWNVQVQDRAALARGVRASIEAVVTSVERALRARDPYTANHQVRVAALACAIAERLAFSEDQMLGLRTAAELHDIGKIGLPSEILNFPGPLSAPAVELIRTHPQVGHDMIETIPFTTPVARIVLEHHERIDGSGYPGRLTGEQLLPESKVLAVADVAEAMTAHRPYRPALPLAAALDELERGRGHRYHAESVDHCRDVLAEGFEFPGLPLG